VSKLHVPEGAWLVCSKGMKKQQIAVTSHNKVTMAGGHLKATIADRPGGNFICGKMALAGAIIGAAAGIALVAGSVISGGALAVAACAAIGAGVGVGASLIPSICGSLLKDWTPFDKNVLTAGYTPLLENSQISCLFGGTVLILYSEKAADEFTDITITSTVTDVVGVIALSYILYPALAAIGTTAGATYTTFTTFGASAGLNYLGGTAISAGTAYGVGWGIDQTKTAGYDLIPTGDGHTVKDYVTGFETDPLKIVNSNQISISPDETAPYEHLNNVGGAIGIANTTIGDRTSIYNVTEQSTSIYLDDIQETGPTSYTEQNRIPGAIEGRTPSTQTNNNVVNQDFGGRYGEINTTTQIENLQYDKFSFDRISINNSVKNSVINSLDDNFNKPSISSKDGINKGGFYVGLVQDAYKGITNFILKDQAEDLQNALQNEEVKAKAKITVLAGND